MSLPVILRRQAEADLASAYRWYEKRLPGLGVRFLEQVELALLRLADHPEAWPTVHRNVRRVILRRFPYALFYLSETERVVVLAVLHQAQDPERWTHLK
jgi:toxin ParE1/3/4